MKRSGLIYAYPEWVISGVKRLTALGVTGLILAVVMGSVAYGHAAYKFSNPDDEATVAQAPVEIWAEYTEPPTDASYLKVFDPCGEQVDNSDSRADQLQNRVYITQSGDRAGTYRVEWFVDSATDAHSTRGTFTFTATQGDPCPGQAEEQPVTQARDEGSSGDRSGGQDGSSRATGGSQEDLAAASGSDTAGRDRQDGGASAQQRKERNDREGSRVANAEFPPAAQAAEPEEPGLLSDIPIGGLVIALVMVIAIGAAGGFIYAGIMGYHRVSN